MTRMTRIVHFAVFFNFRHLLQERPGIHLREPGIGQESQFILELIFKAGTKEAQNVLD